MPGAWFVRDNCIPTTKHDWNQLSHNTLSLTPPLSLETSLTNPNCQLCEHTHGHTHTWTNTHTHTHTKLNFGSEGITKLTSLSDSYEHLALFG